MAELRRPDRPWACPRDHGELWARAPGWACERCDAQFPDHEGYVDYLPEVDEPPQRGLGPKAMHNPIFARVYEGIWRPLYTSVARGGVADPRVELLWILDQLRRAEGELVVDLSCGPGVIGRQLSSTGRFSALLGIDYSKEMLRRCLDHCAAEGVRGFELARGDAAALPLATDSVGGVHAGNALHLWPQIPASLEEVRRVLRPGGVFVATTFIHAPGWRGRGSRRFAQAVDARFFEPGELRLACEAAGLVEYAERIEGSAIWLRAEAPA